LRRLGGNDVAYAAAKGSLPGGGGERFVGRCTDLQMRSSRFACFQIEGNVLEQAFVYSGTAGHVVVVRWVVDGGRSDVMRLECTFRK